MMRSATELTELPDAELRKVSTKHAESVLESRARGSAYVGSILARMYGYTEYPPTTEWHVIPHVTERHTIGVVDLTNGTAWDSREPVNDDVRALGIDGRMWAGNQPRALRRKRVAVEPIAPPEWRCIRMPVWRGYFNDGRYASVSMENRASQHRIRPHLRAIGLNTSEGVRGAPRRTLADVAGLANHYEHGLPPWVHPGAELPVVKWLRLTPDRLSAVHAVATGFMRDWMLHAARFSPWCSRLKQALDINNRAAVSDLCIDAHGPARTRDEDVQSYTAMFGSKQDIARSILASNCGLRYAIALLEGCRKESAHKKRLADIVLHLIERVLAEATIAARQITAAAIAGVARDAGKSSFDAQCEILPQIAAAAAKLILESEELNQTTLVRRVCDVLYKYGPIFLDVAAFDAEEIEVPTTKAETKMNATIAGKGY